MMAGKAAWLIDTNVLSEIRKKAAAAPSVRAWLRDIDASDLFLSVMTVVEIKLGAQDLPATLFKTELQAWIVTVEASFRRRIPPVTEAVLMSWRQLCLTGQRAGFAMSRTDALIAATASVHGLGVATRNTKDLERTGVALINPWLTSVV